MEIYAVNNQRIWPWGQLQLMGGNALCAPNCISPHKLRQISPFQSVPCTVIATDLGKMDHHIALYADDVILFLSQPEKSIPPLLDQIKDFGKLSEYAINWQKCEFMPLSEYLDRDFHRNLPAKVTTHIIYLGTTIPKQPDQLYMLNYKALIDKLKNDIELWRTLPMSMIGRINAIKMVTLPRFLYMFQNIPICLSKKLFKAQTQNRSSKWTLTLRMSPNYIKRFFRTTKPMWSLYKS